MICIRVDPQILIDADFTIGPDLTIIRTVIYLNNQPIDRPTTPWGTPQIPPMFVVNDTYSWCEYLDLVLGTHLLTVEFNKGDGDMVSYSWTFTLEE